MKVMSYKRYSKSSQTLRYAFGTRLRPVKPELTPSGTEVVLNWGCSIPKPNARCKILNKPEAVAIAVNKLRSFKKLQEAGVKIPDFTTDFNVAKGWIENDEKKVLARTKLEAHSGQGIVLAKEVSELPQHAPLYVKFMPKEHEYRVHVFEGKIIDFVEKKKREGVPEAQFNKYIRSYDNGWVFCRDGVVLSDAVKAEAIKAVAALGLDFGAVDMAVNKKNVIAVFEVNTAPALEGTTVEKYKAALSKYIVR
jgi:predicted ATP-grasp superfamily ATP-dependent carboligase